jgi:hypothetical protein
MIRYTLSGVVLVFSLISAAPVSAQSTGQFSKCRLPIDDDAAPLAPTAKALPSGCETTTRPWAAPVGHRQPQISDITSSTSPSSEKALVEEDARLGRMIRNICRGC